MSRTDLHFHLLPGLDDGPASLAGSIELARTAAEDGTGTVVTTPHVREDQVTDVLGLPDRVRELEVALRREGVELEVKVGGELGMEMVGRLGQSELLTIAQGPGESPWLLLECPFEGIGPELHSAADELRDRGFGVVLAHPERSAGLLAGAGEALERELEAGSLLQMNAWTLANGHGVEAARVGAELLRRGIVSVIASDAHGPERLPGLAAAEGMLRAAGLSAAEASRLTGSAPERLLRKGHPARSRSLTG